MSECAVCSAVRRSERAVSLGVLVLGVQGHCAIVSQE